MLADGIYRPMSIDLSTTSSNALFSRYLLIGQRTWLTMSQPSLHLMGSSIRFSLASHVHRSTILASFNLHWVHSWTTVSRI